MKTLGNILWHFPFFGFLSAAVIYVLGLILTVTVVAAPIGLGLVEFGKFLFVPFGHAMVSKSALDIQQNKTWKAYSTIVMILYVPIGIVMCLLLAIQIAMLFVSILGIPAAIVLAKSLGTCFNPVGKKCVSQAVADELDKRKAEAEISKYVING